MSEPADAPPLRVGLLIDDWAQPAWVVEAVREVLASPAAEVVLVVKNGAPAPEPLPLAERARYVARHALYSAYRALDRRAPGARDAFAPADLGELLRDVPQRVVVPRRRRYTDAFPPEDLEALRAARLDVALRLGFRILTGEALGIARHGVWSYHHGDNHAYRGGPAGFWEVAEGNPVTGSILQVLSEELDAGQVLVRSFAATDRLSLAHSLDNYYWKSSRFLVRALEALHAGALAPEPARFAPYDRPLYRAPGNREMAGFALRLAGRHLRARLRAALFREQWLVAYRFTPRRPDEPATELRRFELLEPPPDRFWADPFPALHAGRHLLFVEEWLDGADRAHVAVLEWEAAARRWSASRMVLAEPHHLSYPCVLRHADQWWMIPESAAAGVVRLYRAVEFPDRWEPVADLLEGVRAVDATPFLHAGRWWMFVNQGVPGSQRHDELFLYSAPDLTGPWTPHPRNPVKSDVRGARPAGRPFLWRGELYRPAQDCSERYGGELVFQRVLELGPERYREEEASRVGPRWRPGLLAAHTFNHCPGLTVVDALRLRARRPL